MADNACLFKLVAKSVGMKYGIIPTFMAKPWGDVSRPFTDWSKADDRCPVALGGSMARLQAWAYFRHIHVSLRNKEGKNIFALSDDVIKAGGRTNAAYEGLKYLTQEAEWFLAGLVDGLADGELGVESALHLIDTQSFPSCARQSTRTSGFSAVKQCGLPTPLRTGTSPERHPSVSSARLDPAPPRRASRSACLGPMCVTHDVPC